MATNLNEAMTAGVYIEFHDASGTIIGQSVYEGWQGRPVPAVGDLLCCAIRSRYGRKLKLVGKVREREFEIQHEADGRPCVWAKLFLDQVLPKSTRGYSRNVSRFTFSKN